MTQFPSQNLRSKIIKPKALKFGDTLGIVACSTPIIASEESQKRSYQRLSETFGFKIKVAPNCHSMYGHAAGTIQERVGALHDMFRDPDVDGILSFWGGYQSHQLLEYLDFDLIRNNPKPFIGYSDTTSLLVAIHKLTGLVCFNGPSAITFAIPILLDFTLNHFKNILIHPQPNLTIEYSDQFSDNAWYLEPDQKMIFQSNNGPKIFRHGQAEGLTMGGNLGTMLLLAGTKYWPDLSGKILFIEEDEVENTKTIDRVLTQLRQMGEFEKISGLVVGRFPSSVGFKKSDSLEMILADAVKGYDFPVITDVDFGHTEPMITLPIGIRCRIDTNGSAGPVIQFLESAVS